MPEKQSHAEGRCPGGGLLRPLHAASRADLTGRIVWTLSNANDGFGDATISLARISTGSMNAHAHEPGGEFMFVASGRGRVWIEGLPRTILRGSSSFIPAGLLHNAQNAAAPDLCIIGITSPGVIPGSYAEVPPLFSPTTKITSVAIADCVTTPDRAPSGVQAVRVDPVSDEGLAVTIRIVTFEPGVTLTHLGPARAWVVVRGQATLVCNGATTHRLGRYATYLAGPGDRPAITAGTAPVSLLEVTYSATSG